jgi:hypothetical protein
MIAFGDALCITHNPVNGTVSQGREGPARVAGCRISLRTPVGIIRKAALWNLCRYRHGFQGSAMFDDVQRIVAENRQRDEADPDYP